MKVLYSQLKKYLPDLKASAREVADAYTKIGFMLDKFIEVEYNGQKDVLLDLEVRQNRADLFGVQGLARELSAFYNVTLQIPTSSFQLPASNYKLAIEIKAEKAVKRVMAAKISNIKITDSPAWLKEYLAHYEINSINNLVDITNYVMIETALPSHVFDTDLVGEKLIWEINPGYKSIKTLNGVELELTKDALLISDGKRPLSLSFIGGGEDAVNNNTKNVILEVGIYDGGLVRRNSRQLKTLTEAGSRLEKYLDPDAVPQAFAMLVEMIKEHTGGEITSEIYDNYLQPTPEIEINIDLNKVQQVAGIEISYEVSKRFLERLGFEILITDNSRLPNREILSTQGGQAKLITVKRPLNRLDIEIEEDVFEEIIRLNGFDKIPTDKLSSAVVRDITPSHLKLMDRMYEILSSNGMDEVRSWVLVDTKKNQEANYMGWEEIQVTNSINEEVPFLRQSIAVSLLGQLETYLKNAVPDVQLFEIGKIFGKRDGNYDEVDSLGIIQTGKDINDLKLKVERLLRQLGVEEIIYTKSDNPPGSAHPETVWDIDVRHQTSDVRKLGIIYVTNTNIYPEASVAEVNLTQLDKFLNDKQQIVTTGEEITQKIVTLDVNIELKVGEDINSYVLDKLKGHEKNLWKWEIVDRYQMSGVRDQVRYTVRVSYVNLSDPEAKKLHEEIF